jgi:hypothetical protein
MVKYLCRAIRPQEREPEPMKTLTFRTHNLADAVTFGVSDEHRTGFGTFKKGAYHFGIIGYAYTRKELAALKAEKESAGYVAEIVKGDYCYKLGLVITN